MRISRSKFLKSALLASAALFVNVGTVHAQSPYQFLAIDTESHGVDVLNGRYDQAIARIRQQDMNKLDFNESTNLCIAYTMSGESTVAMTSCDQAVDLARSTKGTRRSLMWLPYDRNSRDLDLAIALSNRGVALAKNRDYERALEDLREAKSLRANLRAPSRNLAVLQEATSE